MLTTKAMAVLGGLLVCGAAPIAYYVAPAMMAQAGTAEERMTAALDAALDAKASVCWGASQFANAARFEAGEESHLVYTRRRIEGFTGALLDRRNRDIGMLDTLVRAGVLGNDPKVETRRVSAGEELQTIRFRVAKRDEWTKGKGFCPAVPRVLEILTHTKPAANRQGIPSVVVTFEWEYQYFTEWAWKGGFENLMAPMQGRAVVEVHNNGYTVTDIQ